MNLQTVVENWLRDNGYDGLCHSDTECGCRLEGLMPCGEPSPNCVAGYAVSPPADSDANFWIAPTKEAPDGEAKG